MWARVSDCCCGIADRAALRGGSIAAAAQLNAAPTPAVRCALLLHTFRRIDERGLTAAGSGPRQANGCGYVCASVAQRCTAASGNRKLSVALPKGGVPGLRGDDALNVCTFAHMRGGVRPDTLCCQDRVQTPIAGLLDVSVPRSPQAINSPFSLSVVQIVVFAPGPAGDRADSLRSCSRCAASVRVSARSDAVPLLYSPGVPCPRCLEASLKSARACLCTCAQPLMCSGPIM